MINPKRTVTLAADTERFGIVNISVANIRREPVYQSELINQTLLGTVLPIYEDQNDFCYVENWDGYLGWVTVNSLTIVGRAEAGRWLSSEQVIFGQNHGRVTAGRSPDSEGLVDLVTCARVNKVKAYGEYIEVVLPDQRCGFVTQQGTQPNPLVKTGKPEEKVVRMAQQFLGIPYLWGGTSSKAFDCSGFVQTVFRFVGVHLPRDAGQMAKVGTEISTSEGCRLTRVGDLLFFGESARRTTHVALVLDSEQFIHAEGYVRRNSLLPEHELYSPHRKKTLLQARRILDAKI